ncbi:hypothetical protein [Helicobacter sp. T3_23-1059]
MKTTDSNTKAKKRVAIQFYGYLRSFKDCRDSFFKHLVEPIRKAGYEVDIFMHSWDFVEGRVTSWHSEKTTENLPEPLKTPPKDELTALYNLKGISITPQVQSADDEKFLAIRWIEKYRYKSLANAYFSVYSANQLRLNYEAKNGINYDFVIVTRPDLFWHKPFSLDFLGDGSLWGKNHKNKLFGFYSVMEGEQAGLDLLYMANPRVIDKIANIYPTLNYEKLNNADLFNPESVLQNFILDNRVELLNISGWIAPFEIKRTKEYWDFRVQETPESITTPETITINRKEFDRLKRLEHFSGFARYYTNKKIAILRKNTRKFRYPIKRIFGFKTDKN